MKPLEISDLLDFIDDLDGIDLFEPGPAAFGIATLHRNALRTGAVKSGIGRMPRPDRWSATRETPRSRPRIVSADASLPAPAR